MALFLVRDLVHLYHQAQIDLNVQENDIARGVLGCRESVTEMILT